jgi:hypothetical protein
MHANLSTCMNLDYYRSMGVTVQVRDLDPDVQERLRRSATKEGLSLSAFLRRELTELARDLEVRERVDILNAGSIRTALGGAFPELTGISTQQIVDIIREQRGPLD